MNSFSVAAAVGLLICASCAGPRDTTLLRIGDAEFAVEIADTQEERRLGLMFRRRLAENGGMLFVFEDLATRSFWMSNTRIPLSIAFLDTQGVILEIHDMDPFSLETVESRYPARYALEVNQGAFEAQGVGLGDRVSIPRPYR